MMSQMARNARRKLKRGRDLAIGALGYDLPTWCSRAPSRDLPTLPGWSANGANRKRSICYEHFWRASSFGFYARLPVKEHDCY